MTAENGVPVPVRVWCSSCQQWLKHNRGFCPHFPDWHPFRRQKRLEKWSECVCLIHTCYDRWPKISYMVPITDTASKPHLAKVEKDWHPGAPTKLLCSRSLPATGGNIDIDSDHPAMCKQCTRIWREEVEYYD